MAALAELLPAISVTQRTATGLDQSGTTRIYVNKSYPEPFAISSECYAPHMRCYGYVDVRHPSIMWGTTEEVIGDFCYAVRKSLIEAGIIRENPEGWDYLVLDMHAA